MAQKTERESSDSSKPVVDKSEDDGVTKPKEVPLDSSLRTEPIHVLVPEVKLSPNIKTVTATKDDGVDAPNAPLTTLNPVTLRPFSIDELRAHKLESLLSQYTTPEAALKARDDTASELRKMLDENERKNKEIDREMEEKEKTREIERKVYAKKLGKDA